MNQQFISIRPNVVQSNRLSPSSIQYLKLLQLNQFDLIEYINDELLANPLLEEASEKGLNPDELSSFLKSISPSTCGNSLDSEVESSIENTLRAQDSLYDHLVFQLNILDLDESKLRTSKIIINSLNSSGYLDQSLKELSAGFNIDLDELSDCLSIVQSLEPLGVGASSLAECLLLQLNPDDSDFTLLTSIISNHLDLVASNKLQTLSKLIKEPIEKLNILIDKLSKLDPKPGLRYGEGLSVQTEYVIPEIFLSVRDGEIDISIPDSLFPRLRVNSYYRKLLSEDSNPDSREFLSKNLNRALMFIRNLEQRSQTIRRITEQIALYQQDFFLNGQPLRPLNLGQIAESIDMHESTVSRAIKGKHLQCPYGVFSLKYFFSNKSISQNDKLGGSLDIKELISNIIKEEDPYKPYSDSELSRILSAKGLSVARRTVSKYRESMGIKSSRSRRKYK